MLEIWPRPLANLLPYLISKSIYLLLFHWQILQSYEDILRKNKLYLQEKGKLKTALSGLVRCLSLLPCDQREVDSPEKVPPDF